MLEWCSQDFKIKRGGGQSQNIKKNTKQLTIIYLYVVSMFDMFNGGDCLYHSNAIG